MIKKIPFLCILLLTVCTASSHLGAYDDQYHNNHNNGEENYASFATGRSTPTHRLGAHRQNTQEILNNVVDMLAHIQQLPTPRRRPRQQR